MYHWTLMPTYMQCRMIMVLLLSKYVGHANGTNWKICEIDGTQNDRKQCNNITNIIVGRIENNKINRNNSNCTLFSDL
jgi:hypothetical protein